MKYLSMLVFALLLSLVAFSQSDRPKELTPGILASIKSKAETKSIKFKQSLDKEELTATEINFSTDTFKVEEVARLRMDVDYSTSGMTNTVADRASSYDKLLNKYYKLLLNALKPADKNALIAAQRSWITYRDAETKLISTMRKDSYSGGGTIQSNIVSAAYADLVVQRTLAIFNYYNSIYYIK